MKKGLPLKQKLYSKIIIDEKTDCWNWQGGKNNIGYGLIRDGKRMRTTHRVSYELNNGQIPTNLVVCHKCDNPKCINPDHLWVGTRKDNTQDMMKKGRHKSNPDLNWKQKRTVCEHCNKDVAVNVYSRCHGNKCKLKK